MFSSDNNNNNSYPLYYNQSPSFLSNRAIPESNYNNNNIFLQHYYGKFLPPTSSYPPISDNSIVNLSSEPSINQQNGLLYPSNVRVSSSRRPAGKKDRHTKITTAQGVRDRRVRLSMSIAREFFNLQDMLGFDKASKTLGWLLSKSKAAIDELASTSNFKPPVTPDDNEVEEDQLHQEDCTSNNNDDEKLSSKKRKRRVNSHLVNTRNVVNELRRREEARERARERTRKEKIVDDHQQKQLESSSNLMICQSNPEISNGLISKEGISSSVRESVVIKGNYNKSKGSSYNNNYNYEMISSKDEQDNCNYYNDYFNKSASESCNYYSGILQPTGFPALNIINLSTEIHINARPWDTYSNHILH